MSVRIFCSDPRSTALSFCPVAVHGPGRPMLRKRPVVRLVVAANRSDHRVIRYQPQDLEQWTA